MGPVQSTRQLEEQTNRLGRAGPEGAVVDITLDAWRHRAADILLAVVAVAHLPVIVLGWLGHGPPMGPMPKAVGLAVYLVMAAAALCRWIDYRRRVWACLLVLYPALFIASLVAPLGPYAQIGVVTIPIYALVLLGPVAARITIAPSMAIIISAPLLHNHPAVVRMLEFDPVLEAAPPGLVWFRATVQVACLVALMVLLDRFHRLIFDALTQRVVAQRKVEGEMHERRRLEREIAASGDRERRRLGQELHDGVCQQVTAALLRCQTLERRLGRGATLSEDDFAALSTLLSETIDDAHNVARGLCPLEPHPDALAPALRSLVKQMHELAEVRCEFRAVGNVCVPDPEAAQHLYRIAQEALSNAVRHAKATRISIELRGNDGMLTLQIEDDGTGISAGPSADGMGLRTMGYRAQIINGELTVGSSPGGGTRVVCHVPLTTSAMTAGDRV